MNRILKIGIDVHSKSFTFCALEPMIDADDRIFRHLPVDADYHYVLAFIDSLKKKLGSEDTYSIECGYEAGCLGFSLYHQLTAHGVKCTILAPTTMLTQKGKRVKTDARDAEIIARCLAYGGYHPVHVPTEEDDLVKEYIRMRESHKIALRKIKQQIQGLCLRHGHHYPLRPWTQGHLKWLTKELVLPELLRETLNEYLFTYSQLTETLNRLDQRIEKLAATGSHKEEVKHLACLAGIRTYTALSLISETGDFRRFAKGNIFAAYLGLAPGERSSGEEICRTGISKAGNSRLRRLLVEAAGSICRGSPSYKSKVLRARQAGNPPEIIAYADRARVRLKTKYRRMIQRGKKRNVAVAAIARELACYVWGIMTGNTGIRAAA